MKLSDLLHHSTVKMSNSQRAGFLARDGRDWFQHIAVLLRAGDMFSQRAHRMVQGPTFFEDHETFAELYNDYATQMDKVLEFIKGTDRPLNLPDIDEAGVSMSMLPLTDATGAFRTLIDLNKAVRTAIEACRKTLPSGSDNADTLLQQLAYDLTAWDYKLKQRIGGKTAAVTDPLGLLDILRGFWL